jgi:hypothetical protein
LDPEFATMYYHWWEVQLQDSPDRMKDASPFKLFMHPWAHKIKARITHPTIGSLGFRGKNAPNYIKTFEEKTRAKISADRIVRVRVKVMLFRSGECQLWSHFEILNKIWSVLTYSQYSFQFVRIVSLNSMFTDFTEFTEFINSVLPLKGKDDRIYATL